MSLVARHRRTGSPNGSQNARLYHLKIGAGHARLRVLAIVDELEVTIVTAQGLTFYRLADGKIVEDDPFTRPDLGQLLGMTPPAACLVGISRVSRRR